jgi:hypothetical protein
MAEGVHISTGNLLDAAELASAVVLKRAPNGIRYASFGDTKLADPELDRLVQAVPAAVAAAMHARAFYFVPLALPEGFSAEANAAHRTASDRTLVSPIYTSELSDEAICHRNVAVPGSAAEPQHEGVFISARLLRDQFALAFEFFINVGHAFAAEAGIPDAFITLAWQQAAADVRGETSQDAWESRNQAIAGLNGDKSRPDEKAKSEFFESAFADAIAIYLLSLAVDFDYSELREREYPLLAPSALADRLRLMAHLFPPNAGYEFSIRYRRRA